MAEVIHQGTYSRFLQHINADQINTVCELGSRDGFRCRSSFKSF